MIQNNNNNTQQQHIHQFLSALFTFKANLIPRCYFIHVNINTDSHPNDLQFSENDSITHSITQLDIIAASIYKNRRRRIEATKIVLAIVALYSGTVFHEK